MFHETRTFPLFLHLPTELRLMIWAQCLAPRIIDPPRGLSRFEWEYDDIHGPETQDVHWECCVQPVVRNPRLLYVCRESREFVLKRLTRFVCWSTQYSERNTRKEVWLQGNRFTEQELKLNGVLPPVWKQRIVYFDMDLDIFLDGRDRVGDRPNMFWVPDLKPRNILLKYTDDQWEEFNPKEDIFESESGSDIGNYCPNPENSWMYCGEPDDAFTKVYVIFNEDYLMRNEQRGYQLKQMTLSSEEAEAYCELFYDMYDRQLKWAGEHFVEDLEGRDARHKEIPRDVEYRFMEPVYTCQILALNEHERRRSESDSFGRRGKRERNRRERRRLRLQTLSPTIKVYRRSQSCN